MNTPFLEIVKNIDKIDIRTNEFNKNIYKEMLTNMLIRMDLYFKDNNLYSTNDYLSLLDNFLYYKNRYFTISDDLQNSKKGKFCKSKDGKLGFVTINSKNFFYDQEVEGYLCHEFIHMISSGMDQVHYVNDKNEEIEIVFPNKNNSVGYKKIYSNGKEKREILESLDLRNNTFLDEGFTEYLKQQIYSSKDCPKAYPLETNFIELMNLVCNCSKDKAFAEFLQGDMVSYKKAFTKSTYLELDSLLKDLFEEKKELLNKNRELGLEEKIAFTDLVKYEEVTSLVVKTAFRQFEKQKPTINDLVPFIDKLTNACGAFYPDKFYIDSLPSAVKIYNKTVSRNKNDTDNFVQRYNELIQSKGKEFNSSKHFIDGSSEKVLPDVSKSLRFDEFEN